MERERLTGCREEEEEEVEEAENEFTCAVIE